MNKQVIEFIEAAHASLKIGVWWHLVDSHSIYYSEGMSSIFPDNFLDSKDPGYDIGRHLHPDDEEVWRLLLIRCRLNGEAFTIRVRTYLGDEIRWIKQSVQAVRNETQVNIGLLGICQDITDQARFESSARFEKSVAVHEARLTSLGELAGGIAHEINNPLAIIRGAIGVLPKIAENSEALLNKVQMVDKAVQRIAGIVSSLNRFCRPDRPQMMEKHRIGKMFQNALFFLESSSRFQGVTIHMVGDQNLEIFCHEIEMEQVLFYILKLSIKAAINSEEKLINISWEQDSQGISLYFDHSGQVGELSFLQNDAESSLDFLSVGMLMVKAILDNHKAKLSLVNIKKPTYKIAFSCEEDAIYAA